MTSDLSAAAAAAPAVMIAAAAAESAVTILAGRSLLSARGGGVGLGPSEVSEPPETPMGLGRIPVGASMDTLGWAELQVTQTRMRKLEWHTVTLELCFVRELQV